MYTKEEKELIISNIQQFFYTEYDEEISSLKADILFHFFEKEIGKYHYNKGIDDATSLVLDKFSSFEDDLYALRKRK